MFKEKEKKPAQSQFSPEFLSKTKQMLLAQKARLEKELGVFTKKNPKLKGDFNSTFPDYGDKEDENAAEVADYEANLSLEQNLEKTLRDVNIALEKMENGIYGICKYCGGPIEEKRLAIRPESGSHAECKKTVRQEA